MRIFEYYGIGCWKKWLSLDSCAIAHVQQSLVLGQVKRSAVTRDNMRIGYSTLAPGQHEP